MIKNALVALCILAALMTPGIAAAGWKDLYRGLIPGAQTDVKPQARATTRPTPATVPGGFSTKSTYQERQKIRKTQADKNKEMYRKRAEARVASEQEEARLRKQGKQPAAAAARADQATRPAPQGTLPAIVSPAPSSKKQDSGPAWPYRAD